MLRNWGGIVDVTPDRSPIIGKTPVPGLFVNCGWGTGGFKATPGSGHVFAHTSRAASPIRSPRRSARPLPHRRLIDEPPPPRSPIEGPSNAADPLPLLRHGRRRSNSATAARRTSRGRRPERASATRNGPTTFTCATTRRACTPSAGATRGLRALLQLPARHGQRQVRLTVYKTGEPRPRSPPDGRSA